MSAAIPAAHDDALEPLLSALRDYADAAYRQGRYGHVVDLAEELTLQLDNVRRIRGFDQRRLDSLCRDALRDHFTGWLDYYEGRSHRRRLEPPAAVCYARSQAILLAFAATGAEPGYLRREIIRLLGSRLLVLAPAARRLYEDGVSSMPEASVRTLEQMVEVVRGSRINEEAQIIDRLRREIEALA